MKLSVPAHCIPRLFGTLALVAGLMSSAHGADATPDTGDTRGLYLGIGLGLSHLGPRDDRHDGELSVQPGAAKLYGGYQITPNWGVEAGWAHFGRVHGTTVTSDGSRAHQDGDARSLYLAGTGRIALGAGFSLSGKLGVSFGHVGVWGGSDTADTLAGDAISPLLGIGAQYQVTRNLALTLDLEGYGHLSEKVKGATATLGVRYSF